MKAFDAVSHEGLWKIMSKFGCSDQFILMVMEFHSAPWSELTAGESMWLQEKPRTIDMVFAARQMQKKCQEQHVDMYTTFVDLMKAFDTVSHEGLWKIMSKFSCPDQFILMVRQFHEFILMVRQFPGEQ